VEHQISIHARSELQWREANTMKPVARSELMLNRYANLHGHDCSSNRALCQCLWRQLL
jgi:hypothetical protein